MVVQLTVSCSINTCLGERWIMNELPVATLAHMLVLKGWTMSVVVNRFLGMIQERL